MGEAIAAQQASGGERPGRARPANLVADLQAALAEDGLANPCSTFELRRRPEPYADIRVFLQSSADSGISDRLAGALASAPGVASVKTRAAKVSLRLEDGHVAALGRALEEGSRSSLRPTPASDPNRYLIGYLGANSCKALHVGHLRNIVVGHALASVFAAAGLDTTSYSLVGDIGRNVCEALAGLQRFHAAADLQRLTVKADHFAGTCYHDYLEHTRDTVARLADPDDPCGREQVAAADLADTLLQRWWAGDASTRTLWRQLCEAVESGHRETLGRLGVRVDGRALESEHVGFAEELLELGLRRGLLTRLGDGRVVYDTGREELSRLVLGRSDGFPTEHARVLAVFARLLAERGPGCVHIDWNGTEWEPAQAVLARLLEALALLPDGCAHRPVFHEMVQLDGEDMSSSRGEPVLIDEILDELDRSPAVGELVALSRGTVEADEVTALVLATFALATPLNKPLEFSSARLMDRTANRGWAVAEAWCRSRSGQAGRGDGAAGAAYRLAVVQSQGLPVVVSEAIRRTDPLPLVRYLLHLCVLYLASPPDSSLDRLTHTVLGAVLDCLGLRVDGRPRRENRRRAPRTSRSRGPLARSGAAALRGTAPTGVEEQP